MNLPGHLSALTKARRDKFLTIVLGIVFSAYGVFRAYQLRWLCDDAYITFRYADNFLSGLGFVYNAGERVEGYTHFLWLCLITFAQWLGFAPESSVVWMGLSFYLLTLLLFLWIALRSRFANSLTIPFALIALALHYDIAIWATGGLETSLFTFLVSLGVAVSCYADIGPKRQFLYSGATFLLAALTRPDGILFWGIGLLFLASVDLLKGSSLRVTAWLTFLYVLPFLLAFVPYVLWKLYFYGDVLPNTYYAKSAGLSNFAQGFYYIWAYVRGYVSTALIVAVIPYFVHQWSSATGTVAREKIRCVLANPDTKAAIVAMALVLVYGVVFVAKVGGDFMYARFLIPLVPLFYLVIGISLSGLLVRAPKLLNALLIAILLVVGVERRTRDGFLQSIGAYTESQKSLSGILDEHWFWTHDLVPGINLMGDQSAQGKLLRPFFEGADATVVLRAQNNLAYYAKFRTCIEHAGLTDKYIAQLPLQKRGRPGHEKGAPWDYLIARRVHFSFQRKTGMDLSDYRRITFYSGRNSVWGYMITYDRDLLDHLERRFPGSVSYTKFESYLDSYIASIKSKDLEVVRADLKNFDDYYFKWVQDDVRRGVFQRFLQEQTAVPQPSQEKY